MAVYNTYKHREKVHPVRIAYAECWKRQRRQYRRPVSRLTLWMLWAWHLRQMWNAEQYWHYSWLFSIIFMLALNCTINSSNFSLSSLPISSNYSSFSSVWSVLTVPRISSIFSNHTSSVLSSQPLNVSFHNDVCNLWTLAYHAVDFRFKKFALYGLLALSMANSFNTNTRKHKITERKITTNI